MRFQGHRVLCHRARKHLSVCGGLQHGPVTAHTLSRRGILRSVVTALAGPLAGCGWAGPTDPGVDITPAPVPTKTPVQPPHGPSAADVTLEVTALQGFTPDHPARLEITFTNASDRVLVTADGPRYVVPFVDDNYAGEAADGSPRLLLVPDDAKLAVRPAGTDGGWVGEYLPESPTDGCWRLPFDWPEARGPSTAILHVVDLEPSETIRHGCGLYWIDGCEPGTYTFEHRFDLRYETDASTPTSPSRATTGFDLVVDDKGVIVDVTAHNPTVETPAPDW